jgi:hypothetical protein
MRQVEAAERPFTVGDGASPDALVGPNLRVPSQRRGFNDVDSIDHNVVAVRNGAHRG